MSGAPLWLQPETREARAAGGAAAAAGLAGSWPGEWVSSGGDDGPFGELGPGGGGGGMWQPLGTRPVVAVGVVSRHHGACPGGPDCANLAAPMDARALAAIREWVARK